MALIEGDVAGISFPPNAKAIFDEFNGGQGIVNAATNKISALGLTTTTQTLASETSDLLQGLDTEFEPLKQVATRAYRGNDAEKEELARGLDAAITEGLKGSGTGGYIYKVKKANDGAKSFNNAPFTIPLPSSDIGGGNQANTVNGIDAYTKEVSKKAPEIMQVAGQKAQIDKIKDPSIGNACQSLNDVLGSALGGLDELFDNVGSAIDGALDIVGQAITDLGAFFATALSGVFGAITGAVNAAIAALEGALGGVSDALNAVTNAISTALGSAIDAAESFLSGVVGSIGSALDAALEGLGTDLDNLFTAINKEIEELGKVLSDLVDFLPAFTLPSLFTDPCNSQVLNQIAGTGLKNELNKTLEAQQDAGGTAGGSTPDVGTPGVL